MPTTKDAVDSNLSSVHLDAIRGCAAVVVLLAHTRDLFFPSLNEKPEDLSATMHVEGVVKSSAQPGQPGITIGNEAVMIFFVLSGYLVGGSVIKALRRDAWSWKSYLTKRLTRLWVVLIPALALGVMLDHIGLHFFSTPGAIYAGPSQQHLIPTDVASRLGGPVIVANALFLQSILVKTAGTNDSLWSLANEFWYYAAFPTLLLALKKHQKLWLRCAYLSVTLGILLLVGKGVNELFLVWMLGALLSIVPLAIPRGAAKLLAGILAFSLPILFVAVRRAHLPIYEAEWIVALSFTLALYLLLHQTENARKGIYPSISGFFSRISYSLYLVHLPIAVLLCACINNPWHLWSRSPKNMAVFFAFNATLVAASYLFYLAFEANTDKIRHLLFHRALRERHLPQS